MTPQWLILLGALATISSPGAGSAQNPQPAPPGQIQTPVTPPHSPTPPPEQIRPPDPSAGGQTLSDRLSQQHGTLQPPAIDPGMSQPVPQRGGGAMPVIPPPGTPGGDQQVVPK
jgi:hypothetical protein